MTIPRLEYDDNVIAVSKLERILRDGCRITATLRAVPPAGKPPIVPQSLEAARQEVHTPPWRSQGEDTFDTITDRSMLEEHQFSRTLATHSSLSARLHNIMREQIFSISGLVEDAVVHLFGNAG